MPASAIVAGAGGVLSMGTSLIGAIGAGKRAKKVEQDIADYQRRERTNPNERLQVSTAGADLQRADVARSVATGIDKLAMGGSRALIGGLPNMLEQQIAQEQKIASELDQQYNQNQQLKAQGDWALQEAVSRDERDDLLGLGNQLNTYRQEKANNINQFATGALATGIGIAGLSKGNDVPQPSGVMIDPMSGVSQTVNSGVGAIQDGNSDILEYLKIINGGGFGGSSVYNTKFNPNKTY